MRQSSVSETGCSSLRAPREATRSRRLQPSPAARGSGARSLRGARRVAMRLLTLAVDAPIARRGAVFLGRARPPTGDAATVDDAGEAGWALLAGLRRAPVTEEGAGAETLARQRLAAEAVGVVVAAEAGLRLKAPGRAAALAAVHEDACLRRQRNLALLLAASAPGGPSPGAAASSPAIAAPAAPRSALRRSTPPAKSIASRSKRSPSMATIPCLRPSTRGAKPPANGHSSVASEPARSVRARALWETVRGALRAGESVEDPVGGSERHPAHRRQPADHWASYTSPAFPPRRRFMFKGGSYGMPSAGGATRSTRWPGSRTSERSRNVRCRRNYRYSGRSGPPLAPRGTPRCCPGLPAVSRTQCRTRILLRRQRHGSRPRSSHRS